MTRDESKRLCLISSMGTERLIGKCVESPRFHISLKLTIPALGIKCSIPLAKRGKFIRRKVLDLLFNRFNFAHADTTLMKA